jgi:hypothetical protein
VVVMQNHAYVADDVSGLEVVDVSDPAAPAIVGRANTADRAWGVATVGDYAYVTDGLTGLQVVDISNPAAPAIVGGVDTPVEALGVAIGGYYVYIADDIGGLLVAPAQCDDKVPVFLRSFSLSTGVGCVTINWAIAEGSDNAEFLVRACANSLSWEVPVIPVGRGTYTAVDEARSLLDGGSVQYSLYYREDSPEWSLLQSKTARLDRVPFLSGITSTNPNPFNDRTTIQVSLTRAGNVRLSVYDVSGRRVAVLQDGRLERGRNEIVWRGMTDNGNELPSGVYFLRLESYGMGVVETRKVTLVR